jgi:hypothetical protein
MIKPKIKKKQLIKLTRTRMGVTRELNSTIVVG